MTAMKFKTVLYFVQFDVLGLLCLWVCSLRVIIKFVLIHSS
jgi:hypothetical protein